MAKREPRKFEIKLAVRERVPVLLGIAGPSSSGKTYSALRVGSGIQRVSGGDLALIDTENRRAALYADDFKFKHVPFASPFNALSYLDALRFVEGTGAKVCIVDSMSHEHEGEGGHLAMHEAELDRMAGDDWKKRDRVNMLAWGKPAAERRALVNYLQQTGMHIILCYRAKDKVVPIKDQSGKMIPTPIGWQPIAGDDYVYAAHALAMLPPNSGGVPSWQAEAAKMAKGLDKLFPSGKPMDEDLGERVARWLGGDKDVLGVGGQHASRPAPRETPPSDDDAPDWQPEEGWPTFNEFGPWVKWSVEFLKKANKEKAIAWGTWWANANNELTDRADNGNAAAKRARADIDRLVKEAMAK